MYNIYKKSGNYLSAYLGVWLSLTFTDFDSKIIFKNSICPML